MIQGYALCISEIREAKNQTTRYPKNECIVGEEEKQFSLMKSKLISIYVIENLSFFSYFPSLH